MERVVLPERLDSLPIDDPGALANRRELRWFNRFLGTNAWFRRQLLPRLGSTDHVLEVGAGEGVLIHDLFSGMREQEKGCRSWTVLDAQPVFRAHPGIRPVVEDLLRYEAYPDADVIFGNMILHQFEDDQLGQLGSKWRDHARLLVFQEPGRSRFHQLLCSLATLPMSHVSRHDADVSIRAGFRGLELPDLLGLNGGNWDLQESMTPKGAYRMIAVRK